MSMFGAPPRNTLSDYVMNALGAPQHQNALGGLGALLGQIPPPQNSFPAIGSPAGLLGALAQIAQTAPAPSLLSDAEKRYPFIKQYNPVVTMSPNQGGGDYAETWQLNDAGDKSRPRPSSIPMNRIGVEVYRPNDFGATDLAAEFLHVDPYANSTRQALLKSLSPQQIATLKRASGDYADSLKYGETEQKALENATDSAMRGYTVGQWPDSANAEMRYTPQQLQMLNSLKRYMETGSR